jgi:N-methylhydantoinase A
VASVTFAQGGADASSALRSTTTIWVEGKSVEAKVYDRDLLLAGNVIAGPAIVTEMDSTTLILPDHAATVHESGSLLIRPVGHN